MHDKILILDFGSQVTQLIARRVREANVYSEIHPYDVDASFIRDFAPKGVILSGGPSSVTETDTPRVPQAVFELGVPVLGICYGMQAMAEQLGGKVDNGHLREFGYAEVRARNHTSLLEGISDFTTPEGHGMLKVWMSHGDKVLEMPPGFALMASTESCPIAAMADEQRHFYGLQWHPEVTHTVQGRAMIERFVLKICGAGADWEMGNYIDEAVAKIREQVGQEHVILGLSGGVDSSVAAALLHRAIGDQLTCVFVDHGLLRLNEAEQVMALFADNLGVKVIHVDASEVFLRKLTGVTDPEAKRKIIGAEFVEVFQTEAGKLSDAKWLAQGTIYPDVIESAGKGKKGTHTIKSHHNVGGPAGNAEPEAARTAARTVQGRSPRTRREARFAAVDGVSPPVPGPGSGRADSRRSEARFRGPAASRGRDFHRDAAYHDRQGNRQVVVRPDEPGVRGVPAGEERRRDGRRAHLRVRGRVACGADAGLHDRALGASAA
ncbi:GMP synthase (glutamine-hydrolyzing) A subunit [Paraburkholderia bryophila]|uniref:GMP synthase [glutamine-hydrolyzing] n=1 Tax=Paraburkholderia bryophila TaxID=420952 RepID=A0A7Z0B3T0_9BURK|nr:GMP synthase (glutamine-hydrolyzing) A subunit [Paraburkholderia bryophila]